MNGIIEESTLQRMEEIRGTPVRRGLDKAINECFDTLENKKKQNGKEENDSFDMTVCNSTKKEMQKDA